MIDFTIIGHIVIDEITYSHGKQVNVMGPAGSTILAASKLGKKVKLITKVGEDIPIEYVSQLNKIGIDLSDMIVKGVNTTRMILDVRGNDRKGHMEHFCEEIKPEDIKELPNAVMVAPVMGEITWSALQSIKADVMAVDPQGFVRAQWRAKDDSILLRRWIDEGILQRYSVFKSTEDELQSFSGYSDTLKALEKITENGPEVAVATRGEKGALLVTKENKRYKVPVSELKVKHDDMGAGDCFSAGFFCEYLDGMDPLWCASMGSSLASCILETVGPRIDTSLKEIRERAEDVFERIEKL